MKKAIGLTLLSIALCASVPAHAAELSEQVLKVPGFADFLAVDGDTVWTTNDGRVEQWSTQGMQASVAVPRPCGAMTMAFGSLWVANCKGGEVYRIDPETAGIVAIIPAGVGPSGELILATGAGSVWAPSETSGKIARIDPATNTIIAVIDVAPGTSYIGFGFDALWTASGKGEVLQRIDPETDAVTDTVKLGKQPGFLTVGEGAVWVQEQGDGSVVRIDPDTVEISGRVKIGETLIYGDIDVGGGSVWLRTTDDQTFVEIDAETMEILNRIGAPSGSGALRYTPTGIWTTAHDVQTLSWWAAEAEE